MISNRFNRKKFLTTIASGVIGGLGIPSAIAQADSLYSGKGAFDEEYLFSSGLIYMNTGTLGPCSKKTIEETRKLWMELESLPIKFYGKWGAEPLAEKTRNIAASFLGCSVDEIVMTRSTTDGMNAIAQGLRLQAGDRVITTDQEHHGGLFCWEYFKKYYGVIIDIITIPPGENNADMILKRINGSITHKTKLISISHIFSSTGLRQNIAQISALARSKNIFCIVDGAQATGAINVNVKELGCHAYATSGHKWVMGPKGTGLLYLAKEVQDKIRPIQFESNYNTYNDSGGVVNLPGILGLGRAIEFLKSADIKKVEEHNITLRNKLYKELSDINKLVIVSPPSGSLASPLLSCRLPGTIDATAFSRILLEKYKISIRPVHKQWFNGVRFSLHLFNTEEEVDFVANTIRKELI